MPRSEEFPFTTPAESDAHMFIQWKGTNVCLDFHCPCGAHNHLDAEFAYYVRCSGCGVAYRMGTQVIAKAVPICEAVEPVEMKVISRAAR